MKRKSNRKIDKTISDETGLKKKGNKLLIFSLMLKLYEIGHDLIGTTSFEKITDFMQTLFTGH
jgi:hypothetical protein